MTTEHIYLLVTLIVVAGLSLVAIRFKTDSIGSLVNVYVAAVFLWVAIRSLSPIGRDISVISFVVAVFLMEQCSRASNVFLQRVIARWHIIVSGIAHIAIVWVFWRLSILRTLIAVIVYWFVILYLGVVTNVVNRIRAKHVDRRTLWCGVVSSIVYIVIVIAFGRLNLWRTLIAMIVYPFVIMFVIWFVAFVYRRSSSIIVKAT